MLDFRSKTAYDTIAKGARQILLGELAIKGIAAQPETKPFGFRYAAGLVPCFLFRLWDFKWRHASSYHWAVPDHDTEFVALGHVWEHGPREFWIVPMAHIRKNATPVKGGGFRVNRYREGKDWLSGYLFNYGQLEDALPPSAPPAELVDATA
jgi:hypothetical protein